nr:mucin-2-like [Penaeus vannamei]
MNSMTKGPPQPHRASVHSHPAKNTIRASVTPPCQTTRVVADSHPPHNHTCSLPLPPCNPALVPLHSTLPNTRDPSVTPPCQTTRGLLPHLAKPHRASAILHTANHTCSQPISTLPNHSVSQPSHPANPHVSQPFHPATTHVLCTPPCPTTRSLVTPPLPTTTVFSATCHPAKPQRALATPRPANHTRLSHSTCQPHVVSAIHTCQPTPLSPGTFPPLPQPTRVSATPPCQPTRCLCPLHPCQTTRASCHIPTLPTHTCPCHHSILPTNRASAHSHLPTTTVPLPLHPANHTCLCHSTLPTTRVPATPSLPTTRASATPPCQPPHIVSTLHPANLCTGFKFRKTLYHEREYDASCSDVERSCGTGYLDVAVETMFTFYKNARHRRLLKKGGGSMTSSSWLV